MIAHEILAISPDAQRRRLNALVSWQGSVVFTAIGFMLADDRSFSATLLLFQAVILVGSISRFKVALLVNSELRVLHLNYLCHGTRSLISP
jgi:hypothetical protein